MILTNKVVLIGHITKDIDLRYTSSNKPVASFTLAVNKYPEGADFISCVTWNKQAENLKKYCRKGSHIALDGKISTRTYDDKDKKKVYVTEVIADNIQFLDAKNSGQADKEVAKVEQQENQDQAYIDFGNTIELSDDDIGW